MYFLFLHTKTNRGEYDGKSITYASAGSVNALSGGQLIKIEKKIPHPRFDNVTFDLDFALLHMAKSFIFNKRVRAIQLPGQHESLVDRNLVDSIGWAIMCPLSKPQGYNRIFTASFVVVNQTECRKAYKELDACNEELCFFVSDNMVCAMPMDLNVCDVDFGGPLVVDGKLVGVRTFSEIPAPVVFGRVSRIVDWLSAMLPKIRKPIIPKPRPEQDEEPPTIWPTPPALKNYRALFDGIISVWEE